jgi:short-subunit dehydrogenase
MTYLIVGASAGIGRGLATSFAAAGHDLVLVASDERDLAALTADLQVRYGVRVGWVAADVGRDHTYLERIVATSAEMGGLDGLLLPVGTVTENDDCGFDPERARRLTSVNYGAVVAIVTRFLPELEARPRATVVGFGSVAAARGRRRNVAYAAAKRALGSFFESLRHACADSPVIVQLYVLGYVATTLTIGLQTRIPKGTPEGISQLVLRNIHRDVGTVYYPWFWRYLCLAVRHVPWRLFKRQAF